MDQFWAPEWAPKSSKLAEAPNRDFRTRVSRRLLVPRSPQNASRWPQGAKIAPSWPKMGPKIASRWGKLGQDCPRLLQNCSKKAPKTVKVDKDVAFALPLRFLCFSFAAEWGCSRSYICIYPSLSFGEYNSNSNSLCTPPIQFLEKQHPTP